MLSTILVVIAVFLAQVPFVADSQMYGQQPYGQQLYGQQQYGQQPAPQYPYSGGYQQPATEADSTSSPVVQGLEGLHGFKSGHDQLTLAVIPVAQQGSQLTFQVIGFAVSDPESGEAVVYSMKTPLTGAIDPAQNTMQIDISGLDKAVNTAGYTDSSEIYDVMRTDPKVVIIDVDLTYQGKQGSQTTFAVNGFDIVPPDGKMQAFSLQQPTQLVIDAENHIVAMVAVPEMVSTFSAYYGATYPQVDPVVYAQPIPVVAPVYVPYLRPFAFYNPGFVRYNAFHYGTGFRPFFDWNHVVGRDRIGNADRYPIRDSRNVHADRSRNDLRTGQRRGEFAQSRQIGSGVKGGIGGFRGGVQSGARVGGGRAGGGRRR